MPGDYSVTWRRKVKIMQRLSKVAADCIVLTSEVLRYIQGSAKLHSLSIGLSLIKKPWGNKIRNAVESAPLARDWLAPPESYFADIRER